MGFSDNIKNIRQTLFLSQESFAKELGVSLSTVNRWEKGTSKPNYSAKKKLYTFCEKHSLHISFD